MDRRASVVLVNPAHPRDNQLPLRILQALGLHRKARVHALLPVEDIVRALRNLRPDVITGFAGVLSRVAQVGGDDDRLFIRPRFVVVGGEVLTPLMRQQIVQAFSAPVFDFYGSHEFKLIAWECKETGEFHTCDDGLIVEVLKDGCPVAAGERGEVVGTNLRSFAMPLIRYRLGDIVTKGAEICRCGRPFSTLQKIQGRMVDYFPLPDGRTIHPYELIWDKEPPWIQKYQLIQERADRIVLLVAPSTTPPPQELAHLIATATGLLGKDVKFSVSLVPEIQVEPSGKFRVFRSLVQSAYNEINWDDAQISGRCSSGREGDRPHRTPLGEQDVRLP
jgi:phenylacetate-CoA ligase